MASIRCGAARTSSARSAKLLVSTIWAVSTRPGRTAISFSFQVIAEARDRIAWLPLLCRTRRANLWSAAPTEEGSHREPGGCVLWGNKGTPRVAVRSERGSSSAFFSHSALSPGSPLATSSDFFYGSSPGRIPYTIEPGRAKGAIVLE